MSISKYIGSGKDNHHAHRVVTMLLVMLFSCIRFSIKFCWQGDIQNVLRKLVKYGHTFIVDRRQWWFTCRVFEAVSCGGWMLNDLFFKIFLRENICFPFGHWWELCSWRHFKWRGVSRQTQLVVVISKCRRRLYVCFSGFAVYLLKMMVVGVDCDL